VLGFYLRLEDMSSPRSETEWINLSLGPSYTPPRRAWGYDRVELGKCGTLSSFGGETTLSQRLPCGHTGAFHSSGVVPSERGTVLEGRMQDGTVTTESSPGRMSSGGRPPARCHSGMVTGVHTLQSCSIYSYSRVLGHGQCLEDMFVPRVL
jgi:hypothetical protein